MAIRNASIAVGKCYTTPTNEVRRIVKIDGMRVTYVTRGKMAFPSWDKHSWLFASKEAFATEVRSQTLPFNTLAGLPAGGGNDGSGTSARFNNPCGVATDFSTHVTRASPSSSRPRADALPRTDVHGRLP